MGTLLSALLSFLRAALMPRTTLALENAALRQQLAIYQRTQKRARLRTGDRVFWVVLRRLWPDWNRALVIVKPETVIAWHRQGFKLFWRRRSRRGPIGRPPIPQEHIAFIQRISGDHPEWGEDKIAEELAAKFGIQHSASTIRRYMVPRQGPPRGEQTWRTFIRNHAKEVWACDFLTQYTAFFAVAYVFVIMEIGSRRIVHVNVTTNPTLSWVKQQIREATAVGSDSALPRPRQRRHLRAVREERYGRAGRPEAQLPLPPRSLAGRGHGDRGATDPVRRPERIAARRAVHADAAGGGAGPLHLPQRRSRPPRRHRVRPLLQRRASIAGDPRDPGSVSGADGSHRHSAGTLVALPVLGGVQHDYRLVA